MYKRQVLYYAICLITVPGFYASAVAPNLTSDFFGAFRDFGTQAFACLLYTSLRHGAVRGLLGRPGVAGQGHL